jgi:hypothetical protein
MPYGDFKEVKGVASGEGNVDAKSTSTHVEKYEQNSTDKILNSPMFKKISAADADKKKQKELTQKYVYPSHSTGPNYEEADAAGKLTMILNRTTDR